MISPHTPPGTLLVVVNWYDCEEDAEADIPDLKIGDIVTLACVKRTSAAFYGFNVSLAECSSENYGYCIGLFEIAVLPKAITEIFTKAPSPRVLGDVK